MKYGFACKYLNHDESPIPELNFKTTTIQALDRLTQTQAFEKLTALVQHNVQALHSLTQTVSLLPKNQQMFRIGSEIFPVYTHAKYNHLYRDILPRFQDQLSQIGSFLRSQNIRVSMHPGQFVVLSSKNPRVIESSLQEIEYHALVFRLMGYNGWHPQGLAINIHAGVKGGIPAFQANLEHLSDQARSWLTLENDEYSNGLNACLKLTHLVPIVLDVHHHQIHDGEIITGKDSRIADIVGSWRGVRPKMHYSQSKSLENGEVTTSKAKLRAHSDYYFDEMLNDNLTSFTDFDIMCEAKMKNLAVKRLLKG